MNGISAILLKDERSQRVLPPSTTGGHRKALAINQEEGSPKNPTMRHLDLGLLSSKTVSKTSLLFISNPDDCFLLQQLKQTQTAPMFLKSSSPKMWRTTALE